MEKQIFLTNFAITYSIAFSLLIEPPGNYLESSVIQAGTSALWARTFSLSMTLARRVVRKMFAPFFLLQAPPVRAC